MYPKLKENVWHVDPAADTATLLTGHEAYAVPTAAALEFLKMRSHCTGWNSTERIAERSGLPVGDVQALLRSLQPAGIVARRDAAVDCSSDEVRAACVRACRLWSGELRLAYVGNEFAAGSLPRPVLVGWLLEMYHYIRDFPCTIEHAAARASGPLQMVLRRYAREESGHEIFVLQTLQNLGLDAEEVAASAPLPSTRLIGLLMRELFTRAPAAVLMVAALVEAQEFDDAQVARFQAALTRHYGINADAFDPYFRHQEIDVGLGHAQLLEENLSLLNFDDAACLDDAVSMVHDLKHAFELQGLEIKAYFSRLDGRYVPRQRVVFADL